MLRDIDLEVFEGELVSIVGPSGCGKTTFLNAVDGLIRVTGGEILVDGRAVERPGPDRAMVFQHDSLFPWRTVRENVMYGLDLQGRLAKSETQGARAGAGRAGRPQRLCRALSARAVRRHAPARQHRARAW